MRCLGVYQDRGSRKLKGPKIPPCHVGKWRATCNLAAEASSHQLLLENECGCHTTDRWGECTCYLCHDSLLPPQSFLIMRDEHFHLRFWWQDNWWQFPPLTVGRTLVFHQYQDGIFGRNRLVRMFKEEDMVKKKREWKDVLCEWWEDIKFKY